MDQPSLSDVSISPVSSRFTPTPVSISEQDGPLTCKPQRQDTTQRHPDAPSSDEESYCLVRFFNYVKEQLSDFFSWLCSCFSSDDTDTNKSKEEKKRVTREEIPTSFSSEQSSPAPDWQNDPQAFMTMMENAMNDPSIREDFSPEMQGFFDMMKIGKELEQLAKARYNYPIQSDDDAMIVLFDLQKMHDLISDIAKGSDPSLLVQDEEKMLNITAIMQSVQAQMKSPMKTKLSDTDKEEVRKMIIELKEDQMDLFNGISKQMKESLLVYINKVRGECQLPTFTQLSTSHLEPMENAREEIPTSFSSEQSSPAPDWQNDPQALMTMMENAMNNPLRQKDLPPETHDFFDMMKIAKELEPFARARYSHLIQSDDDAMIVLFDLKKMHNLTRDMAKEENPCLLLKDKDKMLNLKTIMQSAQAQMKSPMKTKLSDKDKEEVRKMIIELKEDQMDLFNGISKQTKESLLVYINKVRGECQLPTFTQLSTFHFEPVD